ncbi:hypothetical protein BDQ12DRAFT_688036 [Crucibulum laeve]|uniref:Uncharacterized protein n=1 Tax=Crucibulum laeve TaxID=68775 RepID=A0A5C3LR94_9AGAR|nr:hypothetical protein BDQ12DRAFT_688036 [Crucibulum laeve]
MTDEVRFLRREWKRNKPHLPKSTSLPIFQLIPKDRPIFTCRQCGFTNTLIPLCLWCCWTSDDAHRQFELSTPRARRITAPARVFCNLAVWGVTSSSHHHETRSYPTSVAPSKTPSRAARAASNPWSLLNITPSASTGEAMALRRRDADIRGTRTGKDGTGGYQVTTGKAPGGSMRHVWRREGETRRVEKDSDNVATGTVSSFSQPSFGRDIRTAGSSPTRLRRPIPISFLTDDAPTSSPTSVDRSQPEPDPNLTPNPRPNSNATSTTMNTMHAMKTLSTKSSRSLARHFILDLNTATTTTNDMHIYDTPPKSPSSPTSAKNVSQLYFQQQQQEKQQRTLRRKKHLSIFRASAPGLSDPEPISIELTMHRPQSSQSDFEAKPASSPPSSFVPTHTRSSSQPNNGSPSVRLGHPSRPYYTAIRKNVSRPTSTSSAITSDDLPASFRPQSYPISMSQPRPVTMNSLLSSSPPSPSPLSTSFPPSTFSQSSVSPYSEAYDDLSPRSLPGLPQTFSYNRSLGGGFSMSGETELRMALAGGGHSAGAARGEDTYRFRDMRRDAGLMGRVKKLRRGLKELLAAKK